MVISGDALLIFELAAENAQLRLQLTEAQTMLAGMAISAGDLTAEIEALRTRLSEAIVPVPHERSAAGG